VHAICPVHPILLDLLTSIIFCDCSKLLSFSSYWCTLLLLCGPNTLLSTVFWNTFSPSSSLRLRDQMSQPYKTTGEIKFCVV
jgi:hypothetical protein